jgi:hypothetical protein
MAREGQAIAVGNLNFVEGEERTWIQSGASSRVTAVQQFKGSKVQR